MFFPEFGNPKSTVVLCLSYKFRHNTFWFKNTLYQHKPQIAQTNLFVINIEKGSGERYNTLVNFPRNGTQEWHPAMAPQHGTQQWPPSNETQQWHSAMAPSNGTQQWHPSNGSHPSNGTQQWHAALASNGTQQWHRAMAPSSSCT